MARNTKHIFGFCASVMIIIALTGCEAPQSTVTPPQKTPEVAQPSLPKPEEKKLVPQKQVRLSANGFAGEIVITTESITATEDGFEIPVFLQTVTPDDMVDTVSIKSILPEGVELKEVKTQSGYTAQLDMSEKSAPVVFCYPYSITASSYRPVISSDDPIFTLVYTGKLSGPIIFDGSFFQTSGALIRTDRQMLAP